MTNVYTIDLESRATYDTVALPPRAARSPISLDRDSYTASESSMEKYTHHSRSPSSSSLPPYAPNTDPCETGDDQTVAELAFKYGFFFPLLWVYGAYLLISPLRAPPPSCPLGWLPDKTESEKQIYLDLQRKEELVWARRSLIALITLVVLCCIIVIVVWAVMRSRS